MQSPYGAYKLYWGVENGKIKLEYIDIQDKTMNELQLEESIALINSYDKLHAEIADW